MAEIELKESKQKQESKAATCADPNSERTISNT